MTDRRYLLVALVGLMVLAVLASASPLDYKHIYEDTDYVQEEEEEEEEESGRTFLRHHVLNQPPPASSTLAFRAEDYYDDEEEGEEEVGIEEGREDVPVTTAFRGEDEFYREREFPRSAYADDDDDYEGGDQVTPPSRTFSSPPAPSTSLSVASSPPTRDPLDDVETSFEDDPNFTSARSMAVLNIMDRLLIALGPNFVENLPKAPTNSTLATVPTPIYITAEPCPYIYKRCSSETSFPSCEIPHNTDPEAWSQRFNLYFNVSSDYEKMDIINATLRLYKNNSIPLHYPKPLLIKVYAYTRSLTKRRSRTTLVAEKTVSSDYVGWVTLSVEKIVRRWKKGKTNHGLLITVSDADTIPWEASDIFVIMSCSSGNNSLVPLPFEVQTDEEGQRYPALNIRQGSPNDNFPVSSVSHSLSSPRPSIPSETLRPHHRERSDDYLITNEATNAHHSPKSHHTSGVSHHVNPDHFLAPPVDHQMGLRHHATYTSMEDTIRGSQHSVDPLAYSELVAHKTTSSTESSRTHRHTDSSGVKERRHRRKHHHQRHGNSAAAL